MGAPWTEMPDLDMTAATTSRFLCTSAKIPPMKPGKLDLKDYSGPLQRQLSPLDLSKDVLAALTKEAARFYFGLLDALWSDRALEKWGDKVSLELEDRLWERVLKYNHLYVEEALDFGQSTPVEKTLKSMQLSPALGLLCPVEAELLAPNAGVLSCWTCNAVDYFMKRGEELRLCDYCWRMEPPLLQEIGQFFETSMRSAPLRLASPLELYTRKQTEEERRRANEPDCKWAWWVGDIKAGDRAGYVAARKKELEAEGTSSELKNYGGPLRAEIKITDFCKEVVAKTLVQCSRVLRIMDGTWRTLITGKYGIEVAWEVEERAWEDVIPLLYRYISKALNKVEGTPVERCLKLIQVSPAFGLVNDCAFDLKSPDVGVMTVYRCATRDYFERQGGIIDLSHICGKMEQQLFEKHARLFDPQMKVKPLKLPETKERSDTRLVVSLANRVTPKAVHEPVCSWEFRL